MKAGRVATAALPASERSRADQRRQLPQPRGHHGKALGEREPGALVELGLSGTEEWLAEAERHGPADDGQAEVADCTERRKRPTGEDAGALDDALRCTLRRATGLLLDGATAAVRLQATVATARARPAVGLDDDVADVTGVAKPPLQ